MNRNQICSRKPLLPLLATALTFSVGLTVAPPSFAAQNQNAPQPLNSVDIIAAGGACTFGVQVATSGKAKTIDLQGDRFVFRFFWPRRHSDESR